MKNNKGQIMLLSILILGGVMIGAATIGSVLLRFQVSQVNDAVESSKALFAADAGIEAVSWCFFQKFQETGNCEVNEYQGEPNNGDTFCPEDNKPDVSFESPNVEIQTRCRWDKEEGVVTVRSQGFVASTTRILEAEFIENSSDDDTGSLNGGGSNGRSGGGGGNDDSGPRNPGRRPIIF